ncbi:hypothetical protein AC249_AIPGENE16399 [Exaiptasia diaphana]|nr:hypothetical protein AC249_AIPGENE16399 [Exaiptasia diaphana]
MNPFRRFTGNFSGLLPSLTLLDLTGIASWKPRKELLALPILSKVIGFSLTKYCAGCSFVKSQFDENAAMFGLFYKARCYEYYYKNMSFVLEVSGDVGVSRFKFTCQHPMRCVLSQFRQPTFGIDVKSACWNDTVDIMNIQGFFGSVAQFLLPLVPAGSYIVMDNASIHNEADLVRLFAPHNIRLVKLPTYSYDLNPIEMVNGLAKTFSKETPGQLRANMPLGIVNAFSLVGRQAVRGFYRKSWRIFT